MEVLLDKSGYTGDLVEVLKGGYFARAGLLYIYNFGSNGITLDQQGRLVFTAQGDRAIVRLEKDGKRTVLADRHEGKRLNRPNDLVIKSDGTVFFTDPRPDNNPAMELPSSAVFMIKNGAVRLLDNTYRPNGLAFSPDERYLYVNGEQKIRRYDVQPDGTITNGRVWVDMSMDKTPGNTDGMKVDQKGNVYCTGPGGIWIMSPDGKHVGTILLPEPATNLAFVGVDGKTLFITDRRSLERIRLNTPGILPGPRRPS
jgi:gluconolactonase